MKKKRVKKIKKNMNIRHMTSLFIVICGLLIVFSIGLEVNKSSSTKKEVKSGSSTCTIDGKSGSYNFTFKATELTSGVNYWECRSRSSGTWSRCAYSSGCYTYKINADSGYDQIRNYDKAGNVSAISYLYKKGSVPISGVQSYISVNVSGYGLGTVKIIDDYSAIKGSISDVSIKYGKIAVTGTGKSCSTREYSAASRARKKVCSAGTYNSSTGKCEAESYRLQNDTCWCAMKDDGTGHLKIAWDDALGACGRKRTYCTDSFKSTDSNTTKYDKITEKSKDGNVGYACVGSGGWGSSCKFTRPNNSETFTYYSSISQILTSTVEKYVDYPSSITDYNNARQENVINSLAGFATAGTPTSTSAQTVEGICRKVADLKVTTSAGIATSKDGGTIYVVPIIASAPCNFNSKAPDETNPIYSSTSYYKANDASNSDYFYYCDSSFYDGIAYVDGTYKCYEDVDEYCYNYTVDYYYED